MNTKSTVRSSEQDQKFERKLNHLQGVMGMPHWNFGSPSFDQIKEYDRVGRQLQHKVKLDLFKKTINFLRGSIALFGFKALDNQKRDEVK